jgi:hypothetical protein
MVGISKANIFHDDSIKNHTHGRWNAKLRLPEIHHKTAKQQDKP